MLEFWLLEHTVRLSWIFLTQMLKHIYNLRWYVGLTANLCERHTHLLIVSLQQISLATLELLLKLLRFRLWEAPVRSSLLQTKTETQSGEETEDETSEEQDQNKQTKKDTKTPWNHRTTLHIHYGIFIT